MDLCAPDASARGPTVRALNLTIMTGRPPPHRESAQLCGGPDGLGRGDDLGLGAVASLGRPAVGDLRRHLRHPGPGTLGR